MLLIRRFEETCGSIVNEAYFPGNQTHLYIGQEATAAAVAVALDAGDYMFSTHRNHGHVLSRGADPARTLAEILGKATGYCKGKAGSLHGCAPELNIPTSSAMVGGNLPIAVGAGFTLKHQGKPNISVMMFGDGVLEEGAFYEALNLAALWKLPVLFLCENNGWQAAEVSTPGLHPTESLAVGQLVHVAEAFQVPTLVVDGADLGQVYNATVSARERAVSGGGPTFVEARMHRWPGNTGETDVARAWTRRVPQQHRSRRAWYLRDDPVLRLAQELLTAGIASRREILAMDSQARQGMAGALRFALDSPYPLPEEAFTEVWPE
jgi:pyruvate dehydrogenase E1 component alpha subunit